MSISINSYRLNTLREKFENRDFAIPSIQRLYVWDKRRICDLMDSIFRHFPIGICLIWNAQHKNAVQIRPNSKTIIPPLKLKNNRAELIIDGQQRLSTIYGVLFGTEPKPEANSFVNFKQRFIRVLDVQVIHQHAEGDPALSQRHHRLAQPVEQRDRAHRAQRPLHRFRWEMSTRSPSPAPAPAEKSRPSGKGTMQPVCVNTSRLAAWMPSSWASERTLNHCLRCATPQARFIS